MKKFLTCAISLLFATTVASVNDTFTYDLVIKNAIVSDGIGAVPQLISIAA